MQKIGAICVYVVLLTSLVIGFSSWTTVSPGNRGVVLRMGAVQHRVLNEGFNWKTPWVERVHEMEVRVVTDQVTSESASKDLQEVHATVAVNYNVSPEDCWRVYQNVGDDYRNRIIGPAMQESIKAVMAQFTAEELITKRETVREDIRKLLAAKLAVHTILLRDVNIVNFGFSHSFNTAIEAKVTAEQNALASKNLLAQKTFEAQQAVATSKGKAEAMSIESDALRQNPQILQLRALEKWDGVLPRMTGGTIPFIDVMRLADVK
jgi:regulator of protease activity HflC (stomatin/prohibitin superfamily)